MCKHHWVYESPNGNQVLKGMCLKCGDKSEAPASTEETTWREMDLMKMMALDVR